ncbi:calycin-like domain-containing protein [Prevotella sp. 885]|uniref:calycin-like domain-containing protein n=1 Tax=Prevotella sp. 885 TaxID=2022527 RepID=UPI000BA0CF7F|nr:calycin-like domain-containing protein [Prevotella sp. 885]OZT05294.1 hypothetical protein CHL74_00015 [Prevotella sp. 885]
MKKILSLLSLLVMTLTAFATDYTGHRTVTYGSNEPTESDNAVVSIVDNGDGTYNVSFVDVINVDGPYRDNYGTYTFSNLACTTENGVTTFTGSGLTAAATHSNPNSDYSFIKSASEGELTVKFNAEKAYAKFAATISTGWSSATISAEFGTDDFETGGGEPEGPTVVSSKSFTDKLGMKMGEGVYDLPYSAEVTVKEMSDGSNNIDFSFGSSVIEANGLTKGTDAKGRTTYSGDVDVQGTVYKVYAVIYTDADGTEKIYMSVESEGVTYIVGTQPVDGPSIPMENYQADGTGFVVSTPIDWETQKFQAVIDATNCNSSNTEEIFGFGPEATVWEKNIHIYADKGTYKAFYQCSNGNNNTTVNITDKTNITVEVSKADGLTVDGVSVIAADKLEGLFDLTEVKFGSGENSQFSNALYKSVKLVEVVPPFVPETKTYKDVAYSSFAGTNTNFDENTVEFTTVEDGTYNVVYKNLTVSSNRIGDLNIPNVTATTDADGNVTYTTTATEGTWTNINQDLASMLGISEGSPATLKSFTATLSGEKLNMTVVTALTGVDATLVFGEQYVEPNPDPEGTIDVVEHGFNANGFGWQEVKDINWDNQYLKAEMDLTNCTSENEVVLSVGNNITAWGATNFHLYYTAATKTLQYNYIDASGNIGRYDIPNIEGTVTVEISKKNGLVVNGEKCNYKNGSTEQFDDPATAFASLWAVSSVQIGAIQGYTMGYAVYNYIHILPVEAEPVDPNEVVATKTYTDNLTVGHDAQTGDVTGYADKQVVFTKYANGESSVTFKEYPISETETRDLTFRGTISETDMSEYGMGTVTFGEDLAMTPIEDETSAFYGKEISLFINISSYSADKMEFTYEFGSEDGIYYVGQYGVEIEKPEEVVGTKTYTANLTVDHDATLQNEVLYKDKDVVFTKYSTGDVTVTFKAFPVSENETCDLTFRGTISEVDMSEYGMGVMVFGENMVCKVEDEASSLNGQTLYLNINIDKKDDYSKNIVFQYSFANDVDDENADAESIFYCGRYGVVADAISGIQTEMENGNVSIYTVGGAKVNTLQKGINIVRLANGKTIKVVK